MQKAMLTFKPTPPDPAKRNPCGKTADLNSPYEVYRAYNGQWEWRVLKKYHKEDRQEGARWFCAVQGPGTFGGYDLGDTYSSDVLDLVDAGLAFKVAPGEQVEDWR